MFNSNPPESQPHSPSHWLVSWRLGSHTVSCSTGRLDPRFRPALAHSRLCLVQYLKPMTSTTRTILTSMDRSCTLSRRLKRSSPCPLLFHARIRVVSLISCSMTSPLSNTGRHPLGQDSFLISPSVQPSWPTLTYILMYIILLNFIL